MNKIKKYTLQNTKPNSQNMKFLLMKVMPESRRPDICVTTTCVIDLGEEVLLRFALLRCLYLVLCLKVISVA